MDKQEKINKELISVLKQLRDYELDNLDIDWSEYETGCRDIEYTRELTLIQETLDKYDLKQSKNKWEITDKEKMLKLLEAIRQIDIKQNLLNIEKEKAMQDIHKYFEDLRESEELKDGE